MYIQIEKLKVKGTKNDAERALYNWVQNSNISELIKVSYNLIQIEKTNTPNPYYIESTIKQNNYERDFEKYLNDSMSLNPFVKAKEPEIPSLITSINSQRPFLSREIKIWEILIMYK